MRDVTMTTSFPAAWLTRGSSREDLTCWSFTIGRGPQSPISMAKRKVHMRKSRWYQRSAHVVCVVSAHTTAREMLSCVECWGLGQISTYEGIPGAPPKNGTVDTVNFSGLCSDQQLSFSPCWIEHLFLIIITPRWSNLVENFLFYE